MSTFGSRRSATSNERQQPFSANVPWLLPRLICQAILIVGWAGSCWAEERPVIENSIGMKLVSIPAGEFLMGSTEQEIEHIIQLEPIPERARSAGESAS